MSAVDAVYRRLPIPLQNGLLTAKGLQFRMERRGFGNSARDAELAAAERLDADEADALQLRLLRAFVEHAARTSPAHGRAFAAARVSADSLNSLDDLRRLPVLEKAALRGHTGDYRSSAAPGYLVPMHTSGTTGSPLAVGVTLEDMRRRTAVLERAYGWFGVGPFDRNVRFSGHTIFPEAERNGVFWRHNHAASQMLMSSYHLHEANLDRYIEALARFQPARIDGYPSSIALIARRMLRNGERRIRPLLVMPTAETLEDHQREVIAEAFGCPVSNQYASSEGAPFACEDEAGELALFPTTGIIEVVRPGTDEPVAPGDEGELLVTGFSTHAYPLIRYRIGDTGVMAGRTTQRPGFRRLLSITGRREDYIVSPERGPVGRLTPVFKALPSSIVEGQIAQISADAVEVRYVPDPAQFRPEHLDRLRQEIEARLGRMEVRFVPYARRLPRGPSGKLRAVIGLSEATVRPTSADERGEPVG